jgi:hypothetical protein
MQILLCQTEAAPVMHGELISVLLIVLGAVLALLGGFVSQAREDILRRKRAEEDILFQLNEVLLSWHGFLVRIAYRDVLSQDAADVPAPQKRSMQLFCQRLNALAVRLKLGEHRQVAVRVTKLLFHPSLRTEQNLYTLTRQVQMKLNPRLIKQYEKEGSSRPEEF